LHGGTKWYRLGETVRQENSKESNVKTVKARPLISAMTTQPESDADKRIRELVQVYAQTLSSFDMPPGIVEVEFVRAGIFRLTVTGKTEADERRLKNSLQRLINLVRKDFEYTLNLL
jgi:hypothetical protein